MTAWVIAACVAVYAWTVAYRAKVLTRVPKFCQDVAHCVRAHRLVFVKPPNKPLRAVLKHR